MYTYAEHPGMRVDRVLARSVCMPHTHKYIYTYIYVNMHTYIYIYIYGHLSMHIYTYAEHLGMRVDRVFGLGAKRVALV